MSSLITNDIANRVNNYARANFLTQSQAVERIASARLINRGADDPSGLGIASGMRSHLSGLRTANTNLQDAIGFLNLRDQAMAEAGDIMLRLKELAVRASNDATLTSADHAKLNQESSSLISGLSQLNKETEFNGQRVFSPQALSLEAGAPGGFYIGVSTVPRTQGIQSSSIDLKAIYDQTGQPVRINIAWYGSTDEYPDANLLSPDGTEAFGWLYSPSNGQTTVESYCREDGAFVVTDLTFNQGDPEPVPGTGGVMDSAASIEYSGWGNIPNPSGYGYNEEYFIIDDPAPGLWSIILDNESPTEREYGIFVNEPSEPAKEFRSVQVGPDSATNTDTMQINFFSVDALALGLSANLSTVSGANASLQSISSAMDTLNSRRAQDGATVMRLQHILEDNMAEIINIEAARSHIEDADMAQQITTLTKGQILARSNAGASVQANASPSAVLDLIAEQAARTAVLPPL